jgi:hypothetical protein
LDQVLVYTSGESAWLFVSSSNEALVSKVKSPKEKKALSLSRDRRNTFGENAKASRKNIRRGKQRSHMEERRSVGKILNRLRESSEESDAMEADALTRTSIIKSSHSAFKKSPDSPLGEVIKKKLSRRSSVSEIKAATSGLSFGFDRAFDTPYVRELHKHSIRFQIRWHTDPRRFGPQKKKSKRKFDIRVAKMWKSAILRDAPLLRGFFAEQPDWRDKMLCWCDKTLDAASNLAEPHPFGNPNINQD